MNIGEIIAELRADKGMNQEELSVILNVSRPTLANWESGNRRIDIETLVVIADYFGVSCDYLLGRTKHKYNFALENEKNVDAIMSIYETLKKYKIEKE
ncbi:helix-turn-helix domain-containing protein [Clostridium cuniculi]|uniref:helix-turn-helix domain-containing protein n=1 Tax=Clostridium cuniculi TaxID=2548455 RepID=UPI001055B182|nr:helix-turn-helix transcriptional regulator [Clostridium cuniculi]